jgi:hypothetical protein
MLQGENMSTVHLIVDLNEAELLARRRGFRTTVRRTNSTTKQQNRPNPRLEGQENHCHRANTLACGSRRGRWAEGTVVVNCDQSCVTLPVSPTSVAESFLLSRVEVSFDNLRHRLKLEIEILR